MLREATHMIDGRAHQNDPVIKPWNSRGSAIQQSLPENKITIEKFEKSIFKKPPFQEVMDIIKKNQDVLGFANFSFDIKNGEKFKQILDKEDDSVCYVAKQKFTDKVIGFVVFGSSINEDGIRVGAIEALGVDKSFSHGNTKDDSPRNVGSTLLLIACNELYTDKKHQAQDILLTASDEASENFYKRFGFTKSPTADEDGDLIASKSGYPKLESDIVSRAKTRSSAVHFHKDEKQAEKKIEAPEVKQPPSPSPKA